MELTLFLHRIQQSLGILIVLMFLSSTSYSQTFAPTGGINYQAIARDTSGMPISNCPNLNVKFIIWDSIAAGDTLFAETHTTSTNRYGLFTLVIGKGDSVNFDTINWVVGKKFLQVGIDSGGTNYYYMPRTQMMSVPYSLHSKTSLFSFFNWSVAGNETDNTNFLGTTNAQDLIIKTDSIERMRILSTGNIGIGTATPTSPLTIKTLSTAGNELEFVSSGFNADIYANTQFNIGSLSSVNLLTGGSNRLHINSLGNVGIGTMAPTALFEVAGQIKITGGSPGANKILTSDASGLASWVAPSFPYVLGNGLSLSVDTLNSVWTKSGNHIYKNNSGNVGVGTASPDAELEVVSTNSNSPYGIMSTEYSNTNVADAQIWLRKARGTPGTPSPVWANDELGAIKFRGFDSGNGFHSSDQTEIVAVASEAFTSTANGSYLKFLTTPVGGVNGFERMRIEQNGYVGIGTSTPSSKLDVNGTLSITGGTSSELNRTQTGSANLASIAFAAVDSDGTLKSANTSNLNYTMNSNSSFWDSGNNRYKIKIQGETYTAEDYVTIVTLSGTNAKVESNDDGNGNLIITVWSPNNFKIQSDFQFVTYKP